MMILKLGGLWWRQLPGTTMVLWGQWEQLVWGDSWYLALGSRGASGYELVSMCEHIGPSLFTLKPLLNPLNVGVHNSGLIGHMMIMPFRLGGACIFPVGHGTAAWLPWEQVLPKVKKWQSKEELHQHLDQTASAPGPGTTTLTPFVRRQASEGNAIWIRWISIQQLLAEAEIHHPPLDSTAIQIQSAVSTRVQYQQSTNYNILDAQ